MGKNEIKLRRKMLDADDIGQYRNYPALMKQHERASRFRKTVKFFTYSILVTLVVVLFLIVISFIMIRLEKKREQKNKDQIRTAWVSGIPEKSPSGR